MTASPDDQVPDEPDDQAPDEPETSEGSSDHDCNEHPVPYVSDGALGHGWECGVCGAFLQAG